MSEAPLPLQYYRSTLLEVRSLPITARNRVVLPPGLAGLLAIQPHISVSEDHTTAALGQDPYLVDIAIEPTHWPGTADRIIKEPDQTYVMIETRRGYAGGFRDEQEQEMTINFIGSYLLNALNNPSVIPEFRETIRFPGPDHYNQFED